MSFFGRLPYIAGGKHVSYNFVSTDNKLKAITETTFKKVSKEILGQVTGISSLIKYFVMTYKNPNLDGLSILDTPGFNSNDNEDKEKTMSVINECDALFWVFDVNAGTINRSSILLLKEKLNKPLYVVINKVDTKAQSEVDKVEALITKTLYDNELEIKEVLRFSSKSPLSDIMNSIQRVSKLEGKDAYVDDMKTYICRLQKNIEDIVKDRGEQYNSALKKSTCLKNEYNSIIERVCNDCDDASTIPKWTEHLFSSDRFEMSKEDGTYLKEILESIQNTLKLELKPLSEKQIEHTEHIKNLLINLQNSKDAWRRVDECYAQYKKLTEHLN